MKRHIFKTRWGWMGLAGSERGIATIVLPRGSKAQVTAALGPRQAHEAGADPLLQQASRQLIDYLEGTRQQLEFPVTLDAGTAFERRVWRTILRIPYGRVRSYKWVASRVGGPQYARAVGRALGANPVPIIVPCHRVVTQDASLGGFSGGLTVKRRLLRLEGVQVS